MHNEAMCLLALGWMHHPRWRLVMTGNRDEFHARPTAALAPWQDETSVIGGRDLRSGGGWAGVGAGGRMAVVTNVRDPLAAQTGPSRGALVADFLRGRDPAAVHIDRLAIVAGAYAPFNLLLAEVMLHERIGVIRYHAYNRLGWNEPPMPPIPFNPQTATHASPH